MKPGAVDGDQDAEWVRQYDVTLPGCTLKKQIDILALIKQVRFHSKMSSRSSSGSLEHQRMYQY